MTQITMPILPVRSSGSTVSPTPAVQPIAGPFITAHHVIGQSAAPQQSIAQTIVTQHVVAYGAAAQPVLPQPLAHQSVVAPPSVHQAAPAASLASLIPQPTSRRRHRNPNSTFQIFVDASAGTAQDPVQKQQKLDARTPLAVKTDMVNNTCPAFVHAHEAFLFHSPSFWTEQENLELETASPTERLDATPQDWSTAPSIDSWSQASRTRNIYSLRLPALSPPQNMVLYEVLGLDDWHASIHDILSAWSSALQDMGPGPVLAQRREVDAIFLQQIDMAKNILIDPAARRRYHDTGMLPTAA
ncbi:hypothetical protein ACEQ8H_008726 [Pleosporales sp. CAS-2024a]